MVRFVMLDATRCRRLQPMQGQLRSALYPELPFRDARNAYSNLGCSLAHAFRLRIGRPVDVWKRSSRDARSGWEHGPANASAGGMSYPNAALLAALYDSYVKWADPCAAFAKSLENPYFNRVFKTFEYRIPTTGTKVPVGHVAAATTC